MNMPDIMYDMEFQELISSLPRGHAKPHLNKQKDTIMHFWYGGVKYRYLNKPTKGLWVALRGKK